MYAMHYVTASGSEVWKQSILRFLEVLGDRTSRLKRDLCELDLCKQLRNIQLTTIDFMEFRIV